MRAWMNRLQQRWSALRSSSTKAKSMPAADKANDTADVDDKSSTTPPRRAPAKRRWLRRLLLTVLILPVVLLLAALSLAQSEWGTKLLLRATQILSFNHIKADWSNGSLAHGGAASLIAIDLPRTKVKLTNVSGQWSWDYIPLKWHVANINADEVTVTTISSGDDSPIEQVLMPFAIEAQRVQVGTLNIISGLSKTTMTAIDGAVKTDKRNHTINLTNLTQGSAHFSGVADVDGMRPFKLKADVTAISAFENNDYHLKLNASGDLYRLNLKLIAEGGAAERPLTGDGDMTVQLLDHYYIHQGHLRLSHLNPYAFWDKLLKADLDVNVDAMPQSVMSADEKKRDAVTGSWQVVNHAPAPLSDFSLPVLQGSGSFALTADVQKLSDISIELPNAGAITGEGIWQNKIGDFKFDVAGFDLKTVHPKLLGTRLTGPLSLKIAHGEQDVVATLAQSDLQLFADVNINNERVQVKQGRVSSHMADVPDAAIETQGELAYTEGLPFKFKAQLLKFNLASLGDFPSSQLQGAFDISGVSTPEVKLDVKGELADSTWAGVPASGKVDVSYAAPDTLVARVLDVRIGENHFFANGGLGVSSDVGKRLAIDVNAPNLAQLQFGFGGSLTAKGDLTGSLTKPRGKLDASARSLTIGAHSVDSADLNANFENGNNGAMNGTLKLLGYQSGLISFEDINLKVNGTQSAHQFNGDVKGKIHVVDATQFATAVEWLLDGTFNGAGKITDAGWQGNVTQLINHGQPNITLQQAMGLVYENGEFKMSNIAANVADAQLNVDTLNLKGLRVNSKGRITNLIVPQWLKWLKMDLPFYTSDLVIKGSWDMSMGDAPAGGFTVERESGDISFDRRARNTIDLQRMLLTGKLSGHSLQIDGGLDSQKLGKVDVNGSMGLVGSSDGYVISGLSPLNMNAKAQLKELKQFNSLLGVNVRLNGQMQGDMQITGVLNKPIFAGLLTGQNIDFLHVDEGVRLKDGVIKLKLTDSQVDFEQFDFNGIEGKFTVRGQVSYGAAGRTLTARVSMDKLKPFVRLDRQLTLSGNADLGYDDTTNQLVITGKVRADKALIDLPPTLTPSLGDDVVVCRVGSTAASCPQSVSPVESNAPALAKPSSSASSVSTSDDISIVRSTPTDKVANASTDSGTPKVNKKPAKAKAKASADAQPKGQAFVADGERLGIIPQIDMVLELGDDFRFKGQGADVKLLGEVRLKTEARTGESKQSNLRATGVVRVDQGYYKFYGQNLTVERGQITFQGPVDDPALNIRAVRTVGTNEVGVEVTGTLANPSARLVSTPDMPDEEKLSWLLFGRSSSTLNTSDGSAIAGAAALLLGSDQGRKITDKLGIDSFNFGSSDSGLEGTVIGVGKRLSNRFAVSYEQGLENVTGVVKVTWTLSRNWEIILRGGSINGADIQYSKRFDKLR
jgi:translocation and assembly module TamB